MTTSAGAPASKAQQHDGPAPAVPARSVQPALFEARPQALAGTAAASVASADAAGAAASVVRDSETSVDLRPGRRRQRQPVRRSYRLTPRFSGEELEVVSAAAALAGLTPTGYVAKVAVDVATARVRPVPVAVSDAIAELLQARYQVQKFSQLVNQAVAKWHSTEQAPPQLLGAVALVGRVLPRLEEAALAVRLAQHDTRPRRLLAPRGAGVVRREGSSG